MLETSLQRKIDAARALMQRIEAGERLSAVLPQFKIVASLEADEAMQFFSDMLSYGLDHIPGFQPPFKNPAQRKAGVLLWDLCKTPNVGGLSLDSVLQDAWTSKRRELDHMIFLSVFEMERIEKAPSLHPASSREDVDRAFRIDVYYEEVQKALARLRSFVYDRASQVWLKNTVEKERIQLLGPDYRLVLDSIGALDSAVASELTAALDALASENPASWALSALGCRNVVLKLGSLLWRVPGDQYESVLLGKPLKLTGDAEKNKLSAYIDSHWQVETDDEKKKRLEEAHRLVPSIYDRGSKGKAGSAVRRAEAQGLVVDTFNLVVLLRETTGLVPLPSLPSRAMNQ